MTAVKIVENFYDNAFQSFQSKDMVEWVDVTTPHTGDIIAKVPLSSAKDVDAAVQSAHHAFQLWSKRTFTDRCTLLLRFYNVLNKHVDELANIIVQEHGKTKSEAVAEVKKGLETLQWALGLPHIALGRKLEVSRGVYCEDRMDAVGVVVSVVPFNFPFSSSIFSLVLIIVISLSGSFLDCSYCHGLREYSHYQT